MLNARLLFKRPLGKFKTIQERNNCLKLIVDAEEIRYEPVYALIAEFLTGPPA